MSLKSCDDLLLVPEEIWAVTVGNSRHCYLRNCRVLICQWSLIICKPFPLWWLRNMWMVPDNLQTPSPSGDYVIWEWSLIICKPLPRWWISSTGVVFNNLLTSSPLVFRPWESGWRDIRHTLTGTEKYNTELSSSAKINENDSCYNLDLLYLIGYIINYQTK